MPQRPSTPHTDESPTSRYHITRYKRTRYWGVYAGGDLVVVTVYKRGAAEVVQRLQALEPPCPASDHGPVWRPPQQLLLWADDGTPSLA